VGPDARARRRSVSARIPSPPPLPAATEENENEDEDDEGYQEGDLEMAARLSEEREAMEDKGPQAPGSAAKVVDEYTGGLLAGLVAAVQKMTKEAEETKAAVAKDK
jgi:hypothetical protein